MDAREFAADLLFARGEIVKASKHYKSLFSKEAPRASAEEKYAKAIIQISEGKRQLDLIAHYKENPRKTFTPKRNPIIAAALSMAPGFGQVYNGTDDKRYCLICSVCIFMVFIQHSQT